MRECHPAVLLLKSRRDLILHLVKLCLTLLGPAAAKRGGAARLLSQRETSEITIALVPSYISDKYYSLCFGMPYSSIAALTGDARPRFFEQVRRARSDDGRL